ncbi:serine/threonine-protein kinase [Mycolicibacterium komossense]|uniref:non-specific serine/threonine protein kinase n=1 Tax=Mycolicibacterium komossense TaxID=1779 RepID=A0ABT3CEY4_9MYCO|nr:serine/threonine-protein kinase [Mycolicibacterium komossense]MCV7227806.1 serine/threonine protein kinase [Mycolicibacterium komossense]
MPGSGEQTGGTVDGGVAAGYAVDRELGRGGSATVYLAHARGADHQDSTRAVALKVLSANRRSQLELGRLQREFELAEQLEHPHIVEMYDRGPYWLAMQYIDGGNASILHTLANRLTALAQTAEALDYTHRKGIVHCDVKPSNILVSEDFSTRGAVLIDFGVAHSLAEDAQLRLAQHPTHSLTLDPAKRAAQRPPDRPTQVQASLPYAAPELLQGHQPTGATDEYALACTAVELITGKPPFVAPTPIALVEAQLHQAPPKVSRDVAWIPRAFDSILAKAMAKDPEARYESCSEFIRLITRALR